jgi:hypothetical protein
VRRLSTAAVEDRIGDYDADAPNRPMDGSILVQSAMGPIAGMLAKEPAQVCLTEHDQVVHAFPPDPGDQSLRVPGSAMATRKQSACLESPRPVAGE